MSVSEVLGVPPTKTTSCRGGTVSGQIPGQFVVQFTRQSPYLCCMNCLVTAGPTFEPLDDVRRLTNFSTGRLGTELANFLTADQA